MKLIHFFSKYALATLTVCLLFTVLFRFMPYPEHKNYQNVDATLHVLLTIDALAQSPIYTHKLLPTITLGDPSNKNIAWGGAKFNQFGNGIYTSFPPVGFIIPYFTFKILGVPPSINSLFLFNVIAQFLSAFLTFSLAKKVGESFNIADSAVGFVALLATLPCIFSIEALYSFGYVYWVHSLFQVFALLFLNLVAVQAFRQQTLTHSRKLLLISSVALMCATEWTGFLIALGASIACWIIRPIPKFLKLEVSLLILGTAIGSGLLLIFWFGSGVGFKVLSDALLNRFMARNITAGTPVTALLEGHVGSFGLFLWLIPVAIATAFSARKNGSMTLAAFLLITILFALSENLLLKQHATEYHFDRLKLLFLFPLIVPMIWRVPSNALRAFVVAISIAACSFSVATYRTERFFKDIDFDSNKVFLKTVDTDDGILATRHQVRGFLTQLFHRNIYEAFEFNDVGYLLEDARRPVYWIDGDALQNLVVNIKAIYRFGTDGQISVFSHVPCNSQIGLEPGLSETSCAHAGELYLRTLKRVNIGDLSTVDLNSNGLQPFDLTNETWVRGVGRPHMGAVFFVKNSEIAKIVYLENKKNIEITLGDGITRQVTDAKSAGAYINIFLSGPPLSEADLEAGTTVHILISRAK